MKNHFGYATAGHLGALVGINIAIALFQLDMTYELIPLNFMCEALALLLLGGLTYDFLHLIGKSPGELGIAIVPIIAFAGGYVWEILSYGSAAGWLPFASGSLQTNFSYLIQTWTTYGSASIIWIGLPILFTIGILRRKKRIFGQDNVGAQGLLFTMVITAALTMAIVYLLVNFTSFPTVVIQ